VDFSPTPEQVLIRRTARDFAERVLRPRAADLDRTGAFPEAALREAGRLGLLGVNVHDSHGGAEAGAVAYALALAELARGCASTAVPIAVTNMVAEVLMEFGTDEQKRAYVPALVSGESLCGAFALSEPESGSDAASLRTTAERRGSRWVLRGTKQWASSGDRAGVVVVWARSRPGAGSDGISAFVVPRGTPGMAVTRHEDKTGLRGSSTVQIVLEDCALPEDALLGDEGRGFRIAMRALDGGRIGIGAQAVGIATAALEAAAAYARDRRQFDRPLADFQAVQWMLADSALELEASRLLVLRAALSKERGLPFSREAAVAKLYASEAANRICDRAVQIHGGYGYIREFPVERYLRDCRVTTLYEGTSEVQRMVIARAVLKEAGLAVT
jgi:alkylation response protein AidB-like acyl-CoA dehydrogenase